MAQARRGFGFGHRGLSGLVLAAGAALPLAAVGGPIFGAGGGGCASSSSCAAGTLADLRRIEAQANTFTKNVQSDAAVDIDAAGNLLAVWGSRRQEGGNWGIFGQRFDPLGRPLGTEIHINQETAGAQWHPDVAMAPDGSAWAAWGSMRPGTQGNAVVARRFASDGLGACDEALVAEGGAGSVSDATIAADPSGRALVCWVRSIDSSTSVFGRLYDDHGSPISDAFLLASSPGNDSNVGVDFQSQGEDGVSRFVVTWARTTPDGTPTGIHARVVDSRAVFAGPEIAVSDTAGIEPSVACDGQGRFVIAWMTESESRSGNYGVSGARFAADGSVLDPQWQVVAALDPSEGFLNAASVAAGPDGRFAIAFNRTEATLPPQDMADPEDVQRRRRPAAVMAQAYSASAAAEGPLSRLNGYDEGHQQMESDRASRRLAWGAQGQLAVAWSGRTGDEERSGAAVTLLAPAGLDAPAPTPVTPVAAIVHMDADDLAPPERNPEPPGRPDAHKAVAGSDFGFQAWSATEWVPPDPDLAVGPDHIVSVVNMGLKIHDKQGNLLHTQDLRGNNGFFGVGAGTFMFDPVAFYDPKTERYIVGCAEYDNKEGLWVAVSDDSNPMGTWKVHYHNTIQKGGFPDFENMGMDDNVIYFANDHFGNYTNWVTAIDKNALVNGQDPVVKSVKTNNDILSLGAVKNYDSDTTVQYFVSAFTGQSTKLRIEAVKDPLGNINRTSFLLTVPAFFAPQDAPQKGTATRIWTIDTRTKNGVQRNGRLYVSHGVTPSGQNRTMVRWYEIDPRGWPDSGQEPILIQSGNVDVGDGVYTWFGDLTVDENGTMGIVYARSGSQEYPGVGRAWRYKDDPAGTLREHTIMVASTTADQGGRWGDYFGIDNDPSEPGTFWGHGEYRTDNWRTWVGRFSAPTLTCYADCDGSTALDLFDFLCFVNQFNAGDENADCDGDKEFTLFDFLCFVNLFNDGCP
jgi:hypothetical protein